MTKWMIALIGIVGVIGSVAAAYFSHQLDRERAWDEFEDDTRRQIQVLERRFESVQFALNTFQSLYSASEEVTEEEFNVFAESLFLHIGEQHPSRSAVKDFGWINWSADRWLRSFARSREGEVVTTGLLNDARDQLARMITPKAPRDRAYLLQGSVLAHHRHDPSSGSLVLLEPVLYKASSLSGRDRRRDRIMGFVFVTIDAQNLVEPIGMATSVARLENLIQVGGPSQPDISLLDLSDAETALVPGSHALLIEQVQMTDLPFEATFSATDPTLWAPYGQKQLQIVSVGLFLVAVIIAYLIAIDRQNRAYRRATRAAERANEEQSRFLANMSHEIRTPISGIVGMAKLVGKAKLNEREKLYLNCLTSSAESLLAIINDILDFSKIENERMELNPQPTDAGELVRSVGVQFVALARDKEVKLSLRYPSSVARHVRVDALRLRQVLSNLIGNALKFTEEGKVAIQVSQDRHPDNPELIRLIFSVRDTGIGMSEETQARIFDRFRQADVSTTKQYGGTGLGLAISRQLITMMSGEITVQSVPGEGTEFRFWIPVAPVGWTELSAGEQDRIGRSDEKGGQVASARAIQETLQRRLAADQPEASAALPVDGAVPRDTRNEAVPKPASVSAEGAGETAKRGKFKVLLVEDDAVNRLFAEELLLGLGCGVTLATNGEESLAAVRADSFDLILMDCQMPVMDGFEATRQIADWISAGEIPDVPVVALTANALQGDREKCLAAGMSDYLTKPLEEVALRRVVRSQVVKSRKPVAEAQAEPSAGKAVVASSTSAKAASVPPKSDSSPRMIDRAILTDIQNRMKDKFQPMLSIYIEDAGGYVQEISDAVDKGDIASAIRPAHTIKSSSQMIGATAVSKLAAKLEAVAKSARDEEAVPPELSEVLAELKKAFELTQAQLTQLSATAAA